jgi:hypothetical protein
MSSVSSFREMFIHINSQINYLVHYQISFFILELDFVRKKILFREVRYILRESLKS